MKITIELPTGVGPEQLIEHLETIRNFARKRYAALKEMGSDEAKREMNRILRAFPSQNVVTDAVRASIAKPQAEAPTEPEAPPQTVEAPIAPAQCESSEQAVLDL